jgi:hypothetical protein
MDQGYLKVCALGGGVEGWKQAGYPILPEAFGASRSGEEWRPEQGQ